jgi:hypothetical protein
MSALFMPPITKAIMERCFGVVACYVADNKDEHLLSAYVNHQGICQRIAVTRDGSGSAIRAHYSSMEEMMEAVDKASHKATVYCIGEMACRT